MGRLWMGKRSAKGKGSLLRTGRRRDPVGYVLPPGRGRLRLAATVTARGGRTCRPWRMTCFRWSIGWGAYLTRIWRPGCPWRKTMSLRLAGPLCPPGRRGGHLLGMGLGSGLTLELLVGIYTVNLVWKISRTPPGRSKWPSQASQCLIWVYPTGLKSARRVAWLRYCVASRRSWRMVSWVRAWPWRVCRLFLMV